MSDVRYQPGAIVNGHRLSDDGLWEPVPSPLGSPSMGYWERWQSRWLVTALAVSAVTFVLLGMGAVSGATSMGAIDVILASVLNFVFYGLPLGLLVAAFPSSRPSKKAW